MSTPASNKHKCSVCEQVVPHMDQLACRIVLEVVESLNGRKSCPHDEEIHQRLNKKWTIAKERLGDSYSDNPTVVQGDIAHVRRIWKKRYG